MRVLYSLTAIRAKDLRQHWMCWEYLGSAVSSVIVIEWQGIDAGLWEIIKVWHTLPEPTRKEVEAKCLQPMSCGIPK